MDTYEKGFFDIPSRTGELPESEELLSSIVKYDYVVQYTLGGVEVLDARLFEKLPEDLLELRAFNENGELHAVFVDGALRGRVIEDYAVGASTVRVFDELHRLWGDNIEVGDGVNTLTERRGTWLRVTAKAFSKDKGVPSVGIRNYLYEESADPVTGDILFGFSDWRLVELCMREEG